MESQKSRIEAGHKPLQDEPINKIDYGDDSAAIADVLPPDNSANKAEEDIKDLAHKAEEEGQMKSVMETDESYEMNRQTAKMKLEESPIKQDNYKVRTVSIYATTATIDICVNRSRSPKVPNLKPMLSWSAPQTSSQCPGGPHRNTSRQAHGLSPFNHFSGKEHSLRWIRPPVFVKCDEYRAINAICSIINRRQPADNPAPPGPIDRMGHHVNKSTNQVVSKGYETRPTRSPVQDMKLDQQGHKYSIGNSTNKVLDTTQKNRPTRYELPPATSRQSNPSGYTNLSGHRTTEVKGSTNQVTDTKYKETTNQVTSVGDATTTNQVMKIIYR
ncbi:hypothetical protein ACMD2_25382 [Ananas comosus]|uniref:Uncharacterized protein n=1 Tax=Ananas comosus TaxID=4615 RepID=A0A199VFH4_ANACO|nr:hypothetical protein ACMD2_25382 [Ananas comosus]